MRDAWDALLVWFTGGRWKTVWKAFKQTRLMRKYARNPLRYVNRNTQCICGSGKKVKKCCGVQKYVDRKWANDVWDILKGLTPEEKIAVGFKK